MTFLKETNVGEVQRVPRFGHTLFLISELRLGSCPVSAPGVLLVSLLSGLRWAGKSAVEQVRHEIGFER